VSPFLASENVATSVSGAAICKYRPNALVSVSLPPGKARLRRQTVETGRNGARYTRRFVKLPNANIKRKENAMADIAKVITIIGSSPESFAKAADAAVQEAAKTLRGISGADVVSMSAVVENDRISVYRTTVNIAFAVER
jgi:flavin-binding protein dodecin